jgi:hypothetical protein
MVALKGNEIRSVPINAAIANTRSVSQELTRLSSWPDRVCRANTPREGERA